MIQSSYLALVLGVSAMCGALAGFIGFGKWQRYQSSTRVQPATIVLLAGNGLLFATMLIVGLGHGVGEGTATACASTFVLMVGTSTSTGCSRGSRLTFAVGYAGSSVGRVFASNAP